MSSWRVEDEVLLERLEDEALAEALFSFLVPPDDRAAGHRLHPRAGGLIAELRTLSGGADVVSAAAKGEIARLASFVETCDLEAAPPALVHHLAVFYAKVAGALEETAPESSAAVWVRSLAAWLSLAEERSYLANLDKLMLQRRGGASGDEEARSFEDVPLELVGEIARRAEESARELGARGRAALIALARAQEAVRISHASPDLSRRVLALAVRRRNAAIESALSMVAEGLDELSARGELATNGPTLLLRAIAIWSWTSNDEVVEHFIVDRIDKMGWDLYRARNWDALRRLLEPFRVVIDSLAARIEREPEQMAYAAACAQMFVFLSEVSPTLVRRLEMAERAVSVCPSHRNGRVVLAAALCEQAIEAMRAMVVFARREELARIRGWLERAESLYPQAGGLSEARRMLEHVTKGRIAV